MCECACVYSVYLDSLFMVGFLVGCGVEFCLYFNEVMIRTNGTNKVVQLFVVATEISIYFVHVSRR